MLRNDNTILKNGERIYKSQVVDSYLKNNTCYVDYVYLTIDGVSVDDPLSIYHKTPTAVSKCVITTNTTSTGINFGQTDEDSYKEWYFCGNTDSIKGMRLYNNQLDGCYTGDMVCLLNQFPNICCVNFASREVDFNQDLSYSVLPQNIKNFNLFDKGVQGDIATISGFENVECWCFNCSLALTGNFHDLFTKTNALCRTDIRYGGMTIDLNSLTDNNPNYTRSYLQYTTSAEMCADTFDFNALDYIYWYTPYAGLKGNFSGWTFNTGMTYYNTTMRDVEGDITNWELPSGLTYFALCNQGYSTSEISGSLSGWTIPPALTSMYFSYTRQITDVPSDYSNATNLNTLSFNRMEALSGDVGTWIIPPSISTFNTYYTNLRGNLENLDWFSDLSNVSARASCFTGNLSGITTYSGATQINLDQNYLTGNIGDFNFGDSVTYMLLSRNYDTYLDLSTTFNTKNLRSLTISEISGVTGSFSNFILGDALLSLYMCCSNVSPSSDIADLDFNNLTTLNVSCSSLSQDITGMFSGASASQFNSIYLCRNLELSGDTECWNVANTCYLVINDTALSGRLCQTNPYWLCIQNTNICSCVEYDFDFSNRSYYITANNSAIQGDLSGVSINYGVQRFQVAYNSGLCGANNFVDYIFVNRKNWTRNNTSFVFNSISDTVTGVTENLGDLGTWGGSEWDLSEAQVNNLVAGTDYTGVGSNTPWDSKQKIYWMENAFESGGVTRRYVTFSIQY